MSPILHHGDCLEILPTLGADSVDSIVTDPPYGLTSEGCDTKGFMGMSWDHGVPGPKFWQEALRVAKPGAFLLAFGGTRTFHRLACAIEDAGWDIKDCIMWVYASGMPKSLNVAKAIDKSLGAKPTVIGTAADFARDGSSRKTDGSHVKPHAEQGGHGYGDRWSAPVTGPTTEEARKWAGWGTSLKPAVEPIIVARKPFGGTVARNVMEHGTGAMNIDACRVEHVTVGNGDLAHNPHLRTHINGGNGGNIISHEDERRVVIPNQLGRWPANFIHDGSPEVLALFPDAMGQQGFVSDAQRTRENCYGEVADNGKAYEPRLDSGSAARFFFCAKASRADRDEGLELGKNTHPCVKPTALLRYLCRLVTPPDGVVLDPFMGSGSTGKAAMLEGFGFVGIEKEAEYVEIARKRVVEVPFV